MRKASVSNEINACYTRSRIGIVVRKAQLIATCLVQSNMAVSMDVAESIVHDVFLAEFPKAEYGDWNTEVDDDVASAIACVIGRAQSIHVAEFIQMLWWRCALWDLRAFSQPGRIVRGL